MSVIEKEDWRSVIGLVTNAKQVVSLVQDAASKLADYAQFKSNNYSLDDPVINKTTTASRNSLIDKTVKGDKAVGNPLGGAANGVHEELFVPGTVYYIKRNVDPHTSDYFTLWKRHAGEHFERIVLSSNLISDHKCDSHYYALRDVLKGLPSSDDEGMQFS